MIFNSTIELMTTSYKEIHAEKKFLKQLDYSAFEIPRYQRPYCWERKNVQLLLDCILQNLHKKEYRIGSIILNPRDGKYDIVDGQQRITTIALIAKVLGLDLKLKSAQYSHISSKHHIYDNKVFIELWVEDKLKDENLKIKFSKFLIEKCSVNEIIVPDLSEAFQMFDSQNGRGKELEAHNLLKAYHLRAIDNTENETFIIDDDKIAIDREWEKIVADKHENKKGVMTYLLNDIYRVRQWCRNVKRANDFTKKNLDEFKGQQISKDHIRLPYQNLGLLMFLYGNGNESDMACKRYKDEPITAGLFMNMLMTIVNGKLFFDYVNTYYRLYKQLFDSNNEYLKSFQEDYKKYCLYKKHEGNGDTYIRDVYIALLLFVFDRFGEDGVISSYKRLYVSVYRKRLSMKSVYYETMAKYPVNLFTQLSRSKSIDDVDFRVLPDDDARYECSEDIKIRYYRKEVAEFIFQCNKDYPFNFKIEFSSSEDGQRQEIEALMKKHSIECK